MKMNKRGYVHWLIPVTLLVLILGVIAASLMRTSAMVTLTLLAVGGVCGHVLHHRQKVSAFSAQVIIFSFVLGFAATQTLMRKLWVFVMFYLAVACVHYGEIAFRK
jgi:hypothetical protein